MSRVSDTRLRTRTAAAQWVAAGRQPHELTVDLIYAAIKQGSRTTINDELKLWKDEQAKSSALTAAVPPVLTQALVHLWALAVEHGEKVFDGRAEELEASLSQAKAEVVSLQTAHQDLERRLHEEQVECARIQAEHKALNEVLVAEQRAKEAAQTQVAALKQQLRAQQAIADQTQQSMQAEHRQRVDDLQALLATQERAFRQEINQVTQRLEAVQKHVMLQVAEARDARERAEKQLSQAIQTHEQLRASLVQHAQQITILTQAEQRAQADSQQAQTALKQLQAERESWLQQLATIEGQSSAQRAYLTTVERRATRAEARLAKALSRLAEASGQAVPARCP